MQFIDVFLSCDKALIISDYQPNIYLVKALIRLLTGTGNITLIGINMFSMFFKHGHYLINSSVWHQNQSQKHSFIEISRFTSGCCFTQIKARWILYIYDQNTLSLSLSHFLSLSCTLSLPPLLFSHQGNCAWWLCSLDVGSASCNVPFGKAAAWSVTLQCLPLFKVAYPANITQGVKVS